MNLIGLMGVRVSRIFMGLIRMFTIQKICINPVKIREIRTPINPIYSVIHHSKKEAQSFDWALGGL